MSARLYKKVRKETRKNVNSYFEDMLNWSRWERIKMAWRIIKTLKRA